MTDAHDVPPGLQNLLMILVGNKWPTGDETALRAETEAWRDAASAVRDRVDQVIMVKQLVDQGLEGGTRQAFDDNVTALVGTGPDDQSAILPMLASTCDSAADTLDDLANEIETLRITIIGGLAVLAAQLIIDMALWLFGGEEAAAVETAITRAVLQMAVRRAITTMITRVAESILAQVGFTLLAQLIELAQGHRHSLDASQLRTAAINGAVGGAVGVGMGFVGGLARAGAGKLVDTGADLLPGGGGVSVTVGKTAGKLLWDTGFGALAGMAEGAAQDAAFGLSGDWVSGAANGSFNGALGRFHTATNPANKFSLSPADHVEAGLENFFNHAEPPPATPDETENRPPTPPPPTSITSSDNGNRSPARQAPPPATPITSSGHDNRPPTPETPPPRATPITTTPAAPSDGENRSPLPEVPAPPAPVENRAPSPEVPPPPPPTPVETSDSGNHPPALPTPLPVTTVAPRDGTTPVDSTPVEATPVDTTPVKAAPANATDTATDTGGHRPTTPKTPPPPGMPITTSGDENRPPTPKTPPPARPTDTGSTNDNRPPTPKAPPPEDRNT